MMSVGEHHSNTWWQFRSRRLLLAAILILSVFAYWEFSLPQRIHPRIWNTLTSDLSQLRLPQHKYAYATFLAAPEQDSDNDNDDKYFVGARIIAYSLLHDPETKSNESIPLLVLVTNEVAASKRARLEADGAHVVTVGKLSFSWIQTSRYRWRDVLSKLFLFTLTQYERILFLDSDILIMRPMDAIFQDKASTVKVTSTNADKAPPEEGSQPEDFVFAGVTGQGGFDHPWPPRRGGLSNAGFVLFRPCQKLFKYYLTVAESAVGKFNPQYPEQNLWNYAHRRDGNMPWQQLDPSWNVNWATWNDYKKGAKSLHAKWWDPGPEKELKDKATQLKAKMEENAMMRDRDSESTV